MNIDRRIRWTAVWLAFTGKIALVAVAMFAVAEIAARGGA